MIRQGDAGLAMYFISKGDCVVKIKDHLNQVHKQTNILVEGDHFGEIALMYKCNSSATVMCRNYNTLARFSKEMFRSFICDYPEWKEMMKEHIFKYIDINKAFTKKIFNKIWFLESANRHIFHLLHYGFEEVRVEKNEIILKE